MAAPDRVLGIDVTGPGGGASLRGRTQTIPPAVARGRDLVPIVARLLADAGLSLGDLDGIACAVGPGSFTGIRIGVATAAALAYDAGLPVMAVGSLHGIARHAVAAERTLVVLNARRGQLFCGDFPSGEYRCVFPDEAVAGLPADAVVLGEGRDLYPEVFARFPGRADVDVRPDAIAEIGAAMLACGETLAPAQLRPLYLRRSDPEIRRAERDGV
ncbi:MAG: tRNA (adenosine(37)-N6)-threonylcarbamoyltransferase complex dimerization subunit type 1 TsaB [Planctomycetota bacterium]|nr:tRNA (adenosine(37)-N6)-threonylcarbamoyltransferase complex dimerization subunit type 1 TsaB [Planctomycetota bacterium]